MSDSHPIDPESGAEPSEEQTGLRASGPSSVSDVHTSEDEFEPGRVLVGRYRIISCIGKGGMGEVYRVQDLTLGQEVALKFLPQGLATSPKRQALFQNEVRVARRVTHPNVCRIFDIGELAGRLFLSMEFVKGEDLSSLLRRVGRLTEDRGLEVARQLCAGLEAAHEQGVIHRDLKPANVLIDEAGRVRITDFGLAGAVGEIEDVSSGTPAYMAPEQLRGEDVSVRSDLFSLGIILFELFTGRKAFEAGSLNELLKAHSDSGVRTPTSLVRELSPATERAILQCLEHDPSRRPESALAVSAMLPGGDLLREALASGRTPSPDLVAAAGKASALSARLALGGLVLTIFGLFGVHALRSPAVLINRVPFDKPPAVLIDRAQTILSELGHSPHPFDVFGFYADEDYLDFVRAGSDATRWQYLETGRPSALRFWYRSSPSEIVATNLLRSRPGRSDPPMQTPGMAVVELDWEGRLLELVVVPPDAGGGDVPRESAWTTALELAALDSLDPQEVAPEWTPPVFADERRAWSVTISETPLRVEAASLSGSLTWFRVIGPWNQPREAGATRETVQQAFTLVATCLVFAVLIGSCYLAYRNRQQGRGDPERATRVAVVVFFLNMISWLLMAQHRSTPDGELGLILAGCAQALFGAALMWLFYMALEPYVRRIWPQGLVGWTRLFSGHYRDPRVGRDVLVGALFGTGMALAAPIYYTVKSWIDGLPPEPSLLAVPSLAGYRYSFSLVANILISSINNVFLIVLVFVLIWMFVRRAWLALLLMSVILALMVRAQIGPWNPQGVLLFAYIVGMGAAVLWRYGLLAMTTALFFEMLLRTAPFSTGFSEWYAPPTLVVLGSLAAITALAFVSSRAGEPLFGRDALAD